ncbi:uncharacterized protein J8A68_000234 [[Candida] subhashii]|uniref:F-box domain-containing protein n=1 Tax=[Candida] subhashii TaxID=561895 RepID=A0A8J5UUZ9_9ASCO|nr:uncharacterized protein J8A68_000234 [[Candida] subhashii]KAG7666212.1 hypothetical protein J8A68_000234 [[Candida] subhashii]
MPQPPQSLIELPNDILDIIISQSSSDLSSLSSVCKSLKHLINPILYKHILIYDDDHSFMKINNDSNIQSFIHISKLSQFINSLTISNFKLIQSIHIHCHSNFAQFDYYQLYHILNSFWNLTNHSIEFINFDVDNIRKFQSINQYLHNKNCTDIIEENDEELAWTNVPTNNKLVNLKNWSILNIQELHNLPYNPNLNNLDLFIERNSHGSGCCIPASSNLSLNFQLIRSLHLNTTISTSIFNQLSVKCTSLENLSVSYSHSFNQPPLSMESLANKIDFNNLKQLELKLNCLRHDCNCINQFYHDLSLVVDPYKSKLSKLSIINYKAKNSTNNLQQYNYLICHQLNDLFEKFTKIEYLYFNINEFLKIDQLKIDWNKFLKSIEKLNYLNDLIMVDFFNWWLPSMSQSISQNNDNNQSSLQLLLNSCHCSNCNKIRFKFISMSEYDAENNYTHNFNKFNYEEDKDIDNQSINKIIMNKSNSKFLNFIYNQFKSQFNEPLIYGLMIDYFKENRGLFQQDFQQLFKHNCLNGLSNQSHQNNNQLRINFGGIIV